MNEQAHAEDILRRMEVASVHAQNFKGQGTRVAMLDSGVLPDGALTNLIDEDIDFTGANAPRNSKAYHGETVGDCMTLVAPAARLGNLRVIDDTGAIKREWVIAALQHCIDVFPKYRVANLSLAFKPKGCPDGCDLCRKVDEAFHHGIYVVVAAGNTGPKPATRTCPALAPWAIASQATWSKAEAEYWKTHHLRRKWHVQVTGKFAKWYGTSFSAAYASGAAALHFGAFPKLTAAILHHAVGTTVKRMEDEGRVILSHARVRDFLLWLQSLPKHAFISLPGASVPFLEDFQEG
jgi:hypothetical protein